MKIAAYNLPKRITEALKKMFGGEVVIHQQKLNNSTADPKADILVITITSSANKETLAKMPNLKAIVTASTGMDHIDIAECKMRGIEVRNCATYSSNAVAELAIALAFAGLRDLGRMLNFGKSLTYPPTCFYYIGSELSDKKCAVLGTGAIGTVIAKKLIALGCKVVAFSRSENKELVDLNVVYLPLEQALKEAEIVFVALPSTPQTYHMIEDKELLLVREGTAIVNIARGEIINSDSLLRHIARLGFVATDVVEGEAALWLGRSIKIKAVEELAKKKNFLLVPHIGASTVEAQTRLAREVVDAISKLKG